MKHEITKKIWIDENGMRNELCEEKKTEDGKVVFLDFHHIRENAAEGKRQSWFETFLRIIGFVEGE